MKSITFVKGTLGMFPDAVTTRGQKHVRELLAMKNKDIAPLFSLLDYMMASIVLKSLSLWILNMIVFLKDAKSQGVEAYAYAGKFDISDGIPTALSLTESVPYID